MKCYTYLVREVKLFKTHLQALNAWLAIIIGAIHILCVRFIMNL